MTPERLDEILKGFSKVRIAIVGDFFLDKYLEVDPAIGEPSVETGKVAHQVINTRCAPGAAGTVVSNLAALGIGEISAVGAIGNDGEAFDLLKCLKSLNCNTTSLFQSEKIATPTYLKPIDANNLSLAGEHSRYDTKNRRAIPVELINRIANSIKELISKVDAIIVLDQVGKRNHGVVSDSIRQLISEIGEKSDCLIWADSRAFIKEFRNVITKPNQFEVLDIPFPNPEEKVDNDVLRERLTELRSQTNSPIFCTRGACGIVLTDPQWTEIPAVKVSGDVDVTGAGDSVTAGCVSALAAGASFEEAATIGNLVAAVTIQQLATTGTATPKQVREIFEKLE